MKDGGSTERRAFVVKSAGFKDGRIDVDLTATQREFKITLDREATVTEVRPVETKPVVEDKPEKVVKTGQGQGKTGKITKVIKKDPKPEEKEVKPLPSFQGDEKPETVDGKKRDPGKKPEKIDATETIDPFKK